MERQLGIIHVGRDSAADPESPVRYEAFTWHLGTVVLGTFDTAALAAEAIEDYCGRLDDLNKERVGR